MKTWLEEQSGVPGQHSASLLVSRVVTAAVRAVRPGPVAAPVLFELGQVRALWLLVRGRASTERPSDVTISYAAGRGGVHLMIGVVGVIDATRRPPHPPRASTLVALRVPLHRIAHVSPQWRGLGSEPATDGAPATGSCKAEGSQ